MHYHKHVSCTTMPAMVPERWRPSIQVNDDIEGSEWRCLPPSRTVRNWLLKLKDRYLSGDYAEALAAADNAKALLRTSAAPIQLLDYVYYTALAVAALYENASAGQQTGWNDLLAVHQEQLRQWADDDPATFRDKHALLSAVIAGLEGRERDAMRLYEQAIQSARAHGFVQNEGLANELAARFYAACGVEKIADAYLRDARHCYLRRGALGKVRQLDEQYPWLRNESTPRPTATAGVPVEKFDVGAAVKACQAVSCEIDADKLIETLVRVATEHAGAERGLLILFPGDTPRIEAEAKMSDGKVSVALRQAPVTPAELPESLLHHAIRTRETLILDDVAMPTWFSADVYIQQRQPRSVLCLPLVKQARLVGALYFENTLKPRAFTSDRVAVLELVALQAAISLDNAALHGALGTAQADLARMARLTTLGELATSIVHEINQPLSAVVMNGNTCLRWLSNENCNPGEARAAAQCIVRDGIRASEIIRSVRALARKAAPEMILLDLNGAIRKAAVLMRNELCRHDVSLETDGLDDLVSVMGDPVQLQQVILNLSNRGKTPGSRPDQAG